MLIAHRADRTNSHTNRDFWEDINGLKEESYKIMKIRYKFRISLVQIYSLLNALHVKRIFAFF